VQQPRAWWRASTRSCSSCGWLLLLLLLLLMLLLLLLGVGVYLR